MTSSHHLISSLSFFVAVLPFSSLLDPGLCFNPKLINDSAALSNWSPAQATWYGGANGDGSEGGACGYGSAVGKPPFSSMIAAGSPLLFKSGKGCGECYQLRCTQSAPCSRTPVTIMITDECPECVATHFDMSGTAFGSMALPGQADQLRKLGTFPIEFSRIECNYPGFGITFHVDEGSNHYYFAVVVEYEQGDGDLAAVALKQEGSKPTSSYGNAWLSMQKSWGAVWKLDLGSNMYAPFSLSLTSVSGKTLVADDVIPAGWQPGATYRSFVNYNTPSV